MIRKMLFVCALFAGCGGEKLPVDDSFSELAGVDDKSDKFTGRITTVGSLKYGETSRSVRHVSSPSRKKWSAFTFLGDKGDKVTVDVSSRNGDTLAWVVDKGMEIQAFDDDSGPGTNSKLELTLPNGANTTFYIVVREYSHGSMDFTVKLQGKKGTNFFAPCSRDSDCVLTASACCGNSRPIGVRAGQEAAYRDSLHCDPRLACPAVLPPADYMAECLDNKCAAVQAADISCGGFTLNPHDCPPGFTCQGEGLARDLPGSCVACDAPQTCETGFRWDPESCSCLENSFCGGIAGFPCAAGKHCIDNPRDNCDPDNGGADCGGICVPDEDCRTTGCERGQYCTFCWFSYACIPNGAVC